MSTLNPMSRPGATNVALPIGHGQSLATGQYANPTGMGAHTATGNPVSGGISGLQGNASGVRPMSGPYSGAGFVDVFELSPLVAAMPVFGTPASAPFAGPVSSGLFGGD